MALSVRGSTVWLFLLLAGMSPSVAGGPDADGDGIPDATDNCPAVSNPDQQTATASVRPRCPRT
jgi:hypothetical protein